MPAAAGLTQMITIVDKSNKVVGSSKQLKNVFTEAKAAYMERRAEIKAQRKVREERELTKAVRAMSIANEEDGESTVSRSRTHRHRSHRDAESRARPHSSEHRTTRSPRETPRSPASPREQRSPSYASPRSSGSLHEPVSGQMIRRSKTDVQVQPRRLTRTNSAPDIDMDLAYGEFHDEDLRSLPPSPTADNQITTQAQQKDLGVLVTKCQFLLDEANCAQYSARKIVMHLQDNPDAMAAVALTLAEISNVASKLAPGALVAFKTSAPAVMALLASPQFLIAVGVGLGVTVVMFGGYKIIKKIRANAERDSSENLAFGADGQPRAQSMDEMINVKELDRIELWRRGIADAQAESVIDDGRTEVSGYSAATSVEGEFITPFAAQSMGHLPLPQEKSRSKKEKKEREREKDKDKDKDGHRKKSRRHRDRDGTSETASEVSRSSSHRGSDREKQVIKIKKPSPLRRMFAPGTSVRS